MDVCRVRVRIGNNEIEVEGTQEFVTKTYQDFTSELIVNGHTVKQLPASENVIEAVKEIVNGNGNGAKYIPETPPSLASYVKEKGPKSYADRALVIAGYLYKYKGVATFTKADIEKYGAEALLPKSKNVNQDINTNREKGYIEVASTKQELLKAFYVTQEGLAYIDNLNQQFQEMPPSKEKVARRSKKASQPSSSPKGPKEEPYLVEVINLVKTCAEAEAIEKQILNNNNELNRALLPLYIIHEYLDNAYTLTTGQISRITIDLGVGIGRQNALRALRDKGNKYIVSDQPRSIGKATYYQLNRRGVEYLKSVIQGTQGLSKGE